jgi:hypothetical protein
VDTVELKAVTTNPCAVRTFDLLTVTKEDLAFAAPFSLEATRQDCSSFLSFDFDATLPILILSLISSRRPRIAWMV